MKQKSFKYYILAVINFLFFVCFLISNGLTRVPVINTNAEPDNSTAPVMSTTSIQSTDSKNTEYGAINIMTNTTSVLTATIPTTTFYTTSSRKQTTSRTTSKKTSKPNNTTTSYIPGHPSVSVDGGNGTSQTTGTITIKKLDIASNKPIENCVFLITGEGISTQAKTDSNGYCYFTNLKPGTYTVKEISGPSKYINITAQQIIQINKYSMNPVATSYSRRK